jgi:azurin
VDKGLASNPDSYKVTGFNYKYHASYGSPVINAKQCPIRGIVVSDDGLKARLVIDSLRLGYIHEIVAEGVKATNGKSLLHNTGYYTLNAIPEGEKLNIAFAAPKHDHAVMAPAAAKKTTPAKPVAKAAVVKRVTKKPASWGAPDHTITIGTKPGLKFNPEQFQVKAGSKVQVIFNNNDDMLHNLVIVILGSAIQVGETAMKMGLQGQEKNYVPDTPKVLFHTYLLQPHTSESIFFTAPEKPGDYTYVCTIPGHFYSMQGTMKVVK